jgi:hypothetical protein
VHPVAWDDLCSLPFPKLERLLAVYAESDRAAGFQEIERLIDHYPSQRMAALGAKAILVAHDAAQEKRLSRLDAIVAQLPEGDKGFLTRTSQLRTMVSEICRLQIRLDTQDRPFLREPTAALLCEKIKTFQNQISGFPAPLAAEFRQAARHWLTLAEEQHSQAQAVVSRKPIPQVFRAGDPVDRDKEAFISRDNILGELDRQLSLGSGCPGLILYGRRRMGKSTLLKNLDGFLPTSVHIAIISMQDPRAFKSLSSLIELIKQKIQEAWPEADRPATDELDLKAFLNELSAYNKQLETKDGRLLIAIDEYEFLDTKIGEGVLDEDLLVTLRESIQSHRHLTWVFAGSHAIAGLGRNFGHLVLRSTSTHFLTY